MQPTLRAARLNDQRFRRSGLSPDDADALLPEVLALRVDGATQRRGRGMARRAHRRLAQAGGLVGTAPVRAVRPRPDRRSVVVRDAAGVRRRADRGRGRREIRCNGWCGATCPASDRRRCSTSPSSRWSSGHGSATPWRRWRPNVDELEGPDGVTLYDLPGAPRPAADTPAPPRLLPMWDSVLLAHRRSQSGDRAGAPVARDAPQRRRAADGAGRRLRRRRLASASAAGSR